MKNNLVNLSKINDSADIEEKKGLLLPEKLAGYSKKQSDFLLAMLDTGVIAEAAKKSKISEVTAHKWLNEGLAKELQSIRANLIEKDLNRLQLACGLAVNTLIDIIQDAQASKSVKVNACKTILENSMKIREQEQIISRLEELEERMLDNGK
jgi:lipopolysaccharide biosynthesis regulator YciM